MSYYQATGLSVTFRTPLWFANQAIIDSNSLINAYGHEIAADGGYKSATMTIAAKIHDIEDWIESGLGRDVTVYSPEGIVVWNGFVNDMSINFGMLQIKRGPIMNVANRVSVVYTPYVDITGIDPATGEATDPITGETTETTIAEDEDSQARYGILETIVNGGTLVDDATFCGEDCVPDNEAEEIRDAYLAEYKNPETSHTINFTQTEGISLTLNCLGYVEWLNKYVYNKISDYYIQLPYKIVQILAADPNHIISTDYSNIHDDAQYLLLTQELENQNRMAKSIIDELVSQGDAYDNRTMFGIYKDRKAHFSAIPSEVEYYTQIMSRDMTIYTGGQSIVKPWNVLPGRWVKITDFMPGRKLPTNLREDPRNIFIENVRFDAPYGLQLQGSKATNVKQLLAKRGVSGA